MLSRTQLNLTCPYCEAEPDMPCEEREEDPVEGRCTFQGELDKEQDEQVQ